MSSSFKTIAFLTTNKTVSEHPQSVKNVMGRYKVLFILNHLSESQHYDKTSASLIRNIKARTLDGQYGRDHPESIRGHLCP